MSNTKMNYMKNTKVALKTNKLKNFNLNSNNNNNYSSSRSSNSSSNKISKKMRKKTLKNNCLFLINYQISRLLQLQINLNNSLKDFWEKTRKEKKKKKNNNNNKKI